VVVVSEWLIMFELSAVTVTACCRVSVMRLCIKQKECGCHKFLKELRVPACKELLSDTSKPSQVF